MKDTFKVRLVSSTQTEKEFLVKTLEEIYEIGNGSIEEANEIGKALEGPEGLMAYAARVSSPKQTNPKYAGLLKYCIEHKHWSVFEMLDMTLEITTSRAIAQQILRHRSFNFQEFSQRYAAVPRDGFIVYPARRQAVKNRQDSVDDLPETDKEWFNEAQERVWRLASDLYDDALERGIAKECARFLLPLNTKTKLYMKGNLRSWLHYVELRGGHGTQKEHMDIAIGAKEILVRKFPITSEAMGWRE